MPGLSYGWVWQRHAVIQGSWQYIYCSARLVLAINDTGGAQISTKGIALVSRQIGGRSVVRKPPVRPMYVYGFLFVSRKP